MTPRQLKKLQAEKLAQQKTNIHPRISNTFIDSALYKANANAIKTVYYLASLLEKQDIDYSQDLTLIKIDMRKMLKYTEMSSQDIRNNLKAMQETSISFVNEELEEELMINLLPWIDIKYGKNNIELKLFTKIAQLIIDVKKNFTRLNTKELMQLKNKHSLRLLPLLNTIAGYDEHVGKRKRMDLDEFNDLFGTKYKRLIDIERQILMPVKEELDCSSKLSFIYEVNFVNLGKGRPKAKDIIIDIVERNSYQRKLF
jgi:plasmid replication initiation protein